MSLIQPREYPSTILAKDSDDNAASTASATAGSTSQQYFITGVQASYSIAATVGLLQLKDGSTVIWEQYIHGAGNYEFPSPIMGSLATAFSAVLAASGTGGVIGKVNLKGYLY